MIEKNPRFAALYCRLSKNEDAKIESNSIANQKIILLKAAQTYGYENTRFFIDDGYSGTIFERPGLEQLENAIQAGMISVVLVKDISRLGRDYLKVGHYVEHFFPRYDVRFIAVSGGIDSNTPAVDFLPLHSVMDEWYAKDISRKLRTMYQARAAKGEPVGLPVYGYRRTFENPKYWEPDPKAAIIVQRIYQLALQGYGSEQIAKLLESEKVLTPAHYRISQNRSGGGRKGEDACKWASSTIKQILERQEYCGDVVNRKTYSHSLKDRTRHRSAPHELVILKNVHEPIVERVIWEYVQDKRKNNTKRRQARKQSLFSGFLRCGDCGSNLHYHFNQANPAIEYYNCSNYRGNRGNCPRTHYVRLDYLDKAVLAEVNAMLNAAYTGPDQFFCKVGHQRSHELNRQEKEANNEYRVLVVRQTEIKMLMAKLYEDRVNGAIDDETYMILLNIFKDEKGKGQTQCQVLQEQIHCSRRALEGIHHFKKVVAGYVHLEKLTREVLHQLIDWIDVYPSEGKGDDFTQKIVIHYQFIGVL